VEDQAGPAAAGLLALAGLADRLVVESAVVPSAVP